MTPRGASGHRHRDERRLRDLGVGRAGRGRFLRVRVDAPRALRDVGDAERDQLLGLGRDRSVLEGLLIELEECAVYLRGQLAHFFELRADVDAVEVHPSLLEIMGGLEGPPKPPDARRRRGVAVARPSMSLRRSPRLAQAVETFGAAGQDLALRLG